LSRLRVKRRAPPRTPTPWADSDPAIHVFDRIVVWDRPHPFEPIDHGQKNKVKNEIEDPKGQAAQTRRGGQVAQKIRCLKARGVHQEKEQSQARHTKIGHKKIRAQAQQTSRRNQAPDKQASANAQT